MKTKGYEIIRNKDGTYTILEHGEAKVNGVLVPTTFAVGVKHPTPEAAQDAVAKLKTGRVA